MVLFVEKPVGVRYTRDEARDDDNDEIKVSSSSTLLSDTCIEKAKPISNEEAGIIFISNNDEICSHSDIIEQSSPTNHQEIESERIDVCKFILILLVVIGHFIEPYSKVGNTTATIIMHMIYSFHVPAFVCISGHCTSREYSKKKRRKMISNLLIPYLILQPLFCIWYSNIVKQRQSNTMDDDAEDENMMFTPNWSLYNQQPWTFVYPFSHLWYLVSLLTMRIWRPFALEIRYTIPMHLLLGCIVGYSTYIGRYLSLHRTLVLMPYFLLGCIMKEKQYFFPYAKSIRMKLVVLLAIILLVGAAIFATQQGILVEIWFQSDPYDKVYGDSLYGGLFQLACYTWSSIAMVLFFSMIPPSSSCGVQYYNALEAQSDEEEVDSNCTYLRRCYDFATRQRRQRPGQALEKEQDTLLARVYLRLAKWGQRSLYAYIIHMAILMLITQTGYYNHLWEVDNEDTYELANEWSTTRQVLGTVIMSCVITVSLLLRPFFPTCLRCMLEPNVKHILFQQKIEEDTDE